MKRSPWVGKVWQVVLVAMLVIAPVAANAQAIPSAQAL